MLNLGLQLKGHDMDSRRIRNFACAAIAALTLLSINIQTQGYWPPPLQDVEVWTDWDGGQETVHYRVYDPEQIQWVEQTQGPFDSVNDLYVEEGVVLWQSYAGGAAGAHYAVYDPAAGGWRHQDHVSAGSVHDLQINFGTVGWWETGNGQAWANCAVYNPRIGLWQHHQATPIAGPGVYHFCIYDGIVVWDTITDGIASMHYAIYDPNAGGWHHENLQSTGSILDISVDSGIIAWRETGNGLAWANYVIYEPRDASWRHQRIGPFEGPDVHNLQTREGVVAWWVYDSQLSVHGAVYEPRESGPSRWRHYSVDVEGVSLSYLNIVEATIFWPMGRYESMLGYDAGARQWHSAPTVPLAYVTATPLIAVAPFDTTFWSLSIGHSSWDFNDHVWAGSRNVWRAWNQTGKYDAALKAWAGSAEAVSWTTITALPDDDHGAISGFVAIPDNDGGTPCRKAMIKVYNCDFQELGQTHTVHDGTYMIGVNAGSCYYVDAWGPPETRYIQQTYIALPGNIYTRDNRERATPVSVSNGEIVPDIDFDLTLGGRIQGVITDPEGAPVINTSVRAYDHDGAHMQGFWTGSDGLYSLTLEPGQYYVDVMADINPIPCNLAPVTYDGQPGSFNWRRCDDGTFSQLTSIEIQAGMDVQNVNLIMIAAGSISGTVVDTDGLTPLPDVRVELFTENLCWITETWTNVNGEYLICNLVPGQYLAHAWIPRHDGLCLQPVTYDGWLGSLWQGNVWEQATRIDVLENTETSGVDFRLPDGGAITGFVTEQDGFTPIADATVNLFGLEGDYVSSTQTDELGSYSICLPVGDYLLDAWGPWELRFTQQTYDALTGNLGTRDNYENAQSVAVTLGNVTGGIDFELELGGRIEGLVTDTIGIPMENLLTRAFDADGWHIETTGVDPNGLYHLTPAEGVYYIELQGNGDTNYCYVAPAAYEGQPGRFDQYFCNDETLSQLTPVAVASGIDATGIDFETAEAGGISGAVTDTNDPAVPVPDALVIVYDELGCWVGDAWTDGDGLYDICWLPPGEYVVEANPVNDDVLQDQVYDGLPGGISVGDNFANADRVTVLPGATTPDIDFALTPELTFELSLVDPPTPGCWATGDLVTIAWTTNVTEAATVSLTLSQSGVPICPIYDGVVGDAAAVWRIPAYLASGSYEIIGVLLTSSGNLQAQTELFCVDGPALTITSPDGGEEWYVGEEHTITWDSTETEGYIAAYLFMDGLQYTDAPIGYAPVSDGALDWTVCDHFMDGSQYAIGVYWLEGCLPAGDLSDAPFTLTGSAGPLTLELTAPNGGEAFQAGTTELIAWNWNGEDPSAMVDIYVNGNEMMWHFIGRAPLMSQSFDWAICDSIGDSDDYTVALAATVCGKVQADFSDDFFSISESMETPPPPPGMTVTNPTGGEHWQAGLMRSITWTGTDPDGPVTLLLYAFLQGTPISINQLGVVPMADEAFDWEVAPGEYNAHDVSYQIFFAYGCGNQRQYIGSGSFNIPACFGDMTGDNEVNLPDLAHLLGSYGQTSGMEYHNGDLDGDGDIDLGDLAWLLGLYGTSCN